MTDPLVDPLHVHRFEVIDHRSPDFLGPRGRVFIALNVTLDWEPDDDARTLRIILTDTPASAPEPPSPAS